jgi:poly(3-hydroxybutyrate) depolymerase
VIAAHYVIALICSLGMTLGADPALESALVRAGANRPQLERALREVPQDQRTGMEWLVRMMPDSDARAVNADFLLEHCADAYLAWKSAPWSSRVSEDMFLDSILPFANVSERREAWMKPLREMCLPIVASAADPGAAAVRINQQLFPLTKVVYSTKRRRADQSPSESIETGLASCTGLSILLIDACRSVGVPARFVGIPLWPDRSGNHSWVEVWDGSQWRYTGAAEPTGDDLDKGWFTERAATASRENPLNAIYAVTWRDSPLKFPMEWSGYSDSVRAIDVTDRYTKPANEVVPMGMARVRFRVSAAPAAAAGSGSRGERVSMPVQVKRDAPVASPTTVFEGISRDERFDANDHLTTLLPINGEFVAVVPGSDPVQFTVESDGQLVDIVAPRGVSARVESIRAALASGGAAALAALPQSSDPLTRDEAAAVRELVWRAHVDAERDARQRELAASEVRAGDVSMRYWTKVFGERPAAGRSLWISMHGGGGAPARVNDQQWENQKRLYEPAEGIYLVPRAPTDTWNLWHQDHIDALYARLIESLVIAGEVDPNRVYIMGYSAGGDGVYQLAPRMSDRLAAAAMMAGHPNDAKPDGLRNIGFALHMGENDTPYKRNAVAAQWKEALAALAAADAGGYPHQAVIHPGKGHWMDRQDAMALPWMAGFTRDPRPSRIVWLQDDVTHRRSYWLEVAKPSAGTRVVATRTGNTIAIESADDVGEITILLDDEMCDLDKPVTVTWNGTEVHSAAVPRSAASVLRSLAGRADPAALHTASVTVKRPQ